LTIPKSQGKQPFYDARKSSWGDIFPHAPKNPPLVRYQPKSHRKGQPPSTGGDIGKRKDSFKERERPSYEKVAEYVQEKKKRSRRDFARTRGDKVWLDWYACSPACLGLLTRAIWPLEPQLLSTAIIRIRWHPHWVNSCTYICIIFFDRWDLPRFLPTICSIHTSPPHVTIILLVYINRPPCLPWFLAWIRSYVLASTYVPADMRACLLHSLPGKGLGTTTFWELSYWSIINSMSRIQSKMAQKSAMRIPGPREELSITFVMGMTWKRVRTWRSWQLKTYLDDLHPSS